MNLPTLTRRSGPPAITGLRPDAVKLKNPQSSPDILLWVIILLVLVFAFNSKFTGAHGKEKDAAAKTAAAEDVVTTARQRLGASFELGLNGKKPIGPADLTRYAFLAAGVSLPKTPAEQATKGTAVKGLAAAQRGDLLAWNIDGRPGVDLVAVYVGRGKVIVAEGEGRSVREQPVSRYGKPVVRRLV